VNITQSAEFKQVVAILLEEVPDDVKEPLARRLYEIALRVIAERLSPSTPPPDSGTGSGSARNPAADRLSEIRGRHHDLRGAAGAVSPLASSSPRSSGRTSPGSAPSSSAGPPHRSGPRADSGTRARSYTRASTARPESSSSSGVFLRRRGLLCHMEWERNRYDWQGSQICLIGFDELTHFSRTQFFYMLSRNRSTCGVKPRIMATTNPTPTAGSPSLLSGDRSGDRLPDPRARRQTPLVRPDRRRLLWADTAEDLKRDILTRSRRQVTFIRPISTTTLR